MKSRTILLALPLLAAVLVAVGEPTVTEPALASTSPGDFGIVSLAPPVVAIVAALVWRAIVPALLAGVWCGAWVLAGFGFQGLFQGLLRALDVHVVGALADRDHAIILLFSMMIGGLVGIGLENGGMRGLAQRISRLASSRRRGQGMTVSMGALIFFDDYANMLIVGQVMRPITDRLRISREKLAYLVDSTAAPVAAVALMTTWIGFEVSVLETSLSAVGRPDISAYGLFLHSLAYSYYPFLALLLIIVVSLSGRDFGPMAAAEQAALDNGPVPSADPESPGRAEAQPASASALYALIPLLVLIGAMVASLLVTGDGGSFRERLATADALGSLLTASFLGVLAAVAVTLWGRRLSLRATLDAWARGAETVVPGLITLVLAWALADTTEKLGTASHLSSMIGGNVNPGWLPTIVFLLAATVAVATGSAWGTLGLLMPLAVPLAWHQSEVGSMELVAATVASVLAGAVFGDHCSPVSDTTILSSTACGCDLLSHVRTQMPYALFAAGFATLFGLLPASFGVPPWLCLMVGGTAMTITFLHVSRPPGPSEVSE